MDVINLDFQGIYQGLAIKTYQKYSLACGREDMGCSINDKLNVQQQILHWVEELE